MKWLLLFLLLVACSQQPAVHFDDVSFSVEYAVTQEEHRAGLMNREFLPLDHGMLFLYDEPARLAYWMKNTSFPLDIIFLDENMTVINIHHAVPCDPDCVSYFSAAPAKYVLEINVGLSDIYGIKQGSKMVLSE